ncbi:MAG TPA: SusC/RagA family TonB-linked outer membrane protein [Gemmatimonadaceae bacterium]
MPQVNRVRGVLAPLFMSVLVVAGVAATAHAQAAVVSGKITNEQGAPVLGANIFIRQLSLGATTNQNGTYSITVPAARVTSQAVTVTARYIGYEPQDKALTLSGGIHTVDFALKSDPFRLDQVVVTGVADSTSAKNLAFTVAHVSGDQTQDVPAANPLEALAGKVSGLKVDAGVGNPGGTPAIRLRGSTSLQVGASTPLIIVDGVITTNNISDIDAQDIESIEVVKGAAGAAFYGSNAANGVIAISTKRGRNLAENHLTISARTEYGQSDIEHWLPLNHGTRDQFNSDGSIQLLANGNPVVNTSGFDDTAFPSAGVNMYRNQLQTYLGNNGYYNNDFQVGLRRGNTNFSSSFSADHNGGILPFKNGQFKQNARFNVDQGVTDKLDVSGSFTYGLQHEDLSGSSTQGWFNLLQAPPMIDLLHPPGTTDTTSYYPVLPKYADANARPNPLYDLKNQQNAIRRERIIGAGAAHYRVTDWLRIDGNYGTDRLNQQTQTYQPRGYLSTTSGLPGNGSLNEGTTNNVSWNSQVRATATKVWHDLLSTTSGSYQMENELDNNFSASGSKFNVNQVPDLAALDPTQLSVGQGSQALRTTDYMGSQSFTYRDRYIFDGLIRRDGSSLFGSDARWSNFYRIAGAYRVTQDFHIPDVQELKLHVARGTAGLRPDYNYQYETYTLSGGQFQKNTLGNKGLKPAILTENEYGIDAEFLDRFSGQLNYADRTTRDAFLQVPLSSAASGGFTSQWQNAATIGSKTLEGTLQTQIISRRNFSYDMSLTADHTTQKILTLNRAPYRVSADGAQGQNVFWYQAGQSLGIMYGQKFVHTFDQLKQNPAYANANASDYVVNPLGYLVTAASRGKSTEAPIVYVDATGNNNFVLGDVNPDLNYGIANDIRWGNFNFHALFDGQRGGKIYNFSNQWMMQDLRSADMDMTNKAADQKIAEGFFSGGIYNNLSADEFYVQSGAYVKLRELSVAYNVAAKYLPKLGLGRASGLKVAFIGRNLFTWTNYTGFDPDVTSGGDFNYKIDGFKYPPFRTISAQLEITF